MDLLISESLKFLLYKSVCYILSVCTAEKNEHTFYKVCFFFVGFGKPSGIVFDNMTLKYIAHVLWLLPLHWRLRPWSWCGVRF